MHHLAAHVLTARQFEPGLHFPFLVLLVSGGHCQILAARAVGDYLMLGGALPKPWTQPLPAVPPLRY